MRAKAGPEGTSERADRPRVAFIVQRYGQDITGGSEYLCRMVAERLTRWYQVEVLTTCAKDYRTWRNEYTPGRGRSNGVVVYRFPTIQERDMASFNEFSEWIFSRPHTDRDELRWLDQQGPVCPDLIEYLEKNRNQYEAFVFFTYLYYPTYHGLKAVGRSAVLVPTAHDEPPLRLRLYRDVFERPQAFIFNSHAEARLVDRRFGLRGRPYRIAGIGVHVPTPVSGTQFQRQQGLERPYIVFAGRIDAGKNVHELIEYYLRFKRSHPRAPYLVLMGSLGMELPPDPDIIYVGFVSEREKWDILRGAAVTVIPSVLESLSIVALESLYLETPILVHAGSEVLQEHAVRSNGGLFYRDYEEFEAMLNFLLQHPDIRRQLGRQGRQYVQAHFTWPRVLARYRAILEAVRSKP